MSLITTPNTRHHDDIYQAIIDMHAGLSPEDSAAVNARMILILANHIGDPTVIAQAAAIARDPATKPEQKEAL